MFETWLKQWSADTNTYIKDTQMIMFSSDFLKQDIERSANWRPQW